MKTVKLRIKNILLSLCKELMTLKAQLLQTDTGCGVLRGEVVCECGLDPQDMRHQTHAAPLVLYLYCGILCIYYKVVLCTQGKDE